MSATALQQNWSNVEFASTNFVHVNSVTFSQGGQLLPYMGDANKHPTVIALQSVQNRCSITTSDVATPMGIQPGTSGTIQATQPDALGSTGGAINWTLINAVHENTDDTGNWGQFATATATFLAYSSDGTTPPLSFTRS